MEEKIKIKVNDVVKIIDNGKTYPSAESAIKDTEWFSRWDKNSIPNKENLYEVKKININFAGADDISIIESLSTSLTYVIGMGGLEKAPTKIGQKVQVVTDTKDKGSKPIIVEVDDLKYGIKTTVGVKFSRKKEGRHTCRGTCEDGYGWYYNIEDLKLIKDVDSDVDYEDEVKEEKSDISSSEEIIKLTKEISKLTKEIHKKERMQDLLNEAIIEKGKEIAVEDLKDKLKEELDTFIEEKYGILPKRLDIITEKSHKELQGIFHKDFEKICKLVNANIPVMLTGGAGAGKNYTLEQVAEALDLDFYFSNAVNQEYKLTGFVDANGTYHETEFYKAFTKGGMFFLDEIDASSPECLVILNSAIANKYFDFPTGRIKANENFRVVCAGNTYGTGADMVYVGRNVLDGATLDRFVVVPFDYDENVEKQLAYDMELYNFIYNLRKAVNECQLRYIVSMRALINASKMLELGISKREILKTAIIKNMQIDDLNTIYNKLPNSDWKDELDKYIKQGEYE